MPSNRLNVKVVPLSVVDFVIIFQLFLTTLFFSNMICVKLGPEVRTSAGCCSSFFPVAWMHLL